MFSGEVEQWAGPAVDGSDEAKQVDMFLESEHAVIQKAFEEDQGVAGDHMTTPPDIEVRVHSLSYRCIYRPFRIICHKPVCCVHVAWLSSHGEHRHGKVGALAAAFKSN